MFVEGEVEIKVRDRAAEGLDDHELKLWLKRSFREQACYRISALKRGPERTLRASVALSTAVLAEPERQALEAHGSDVAALRRFLEATFVGKGEIRAVGEPKLRQS